MLHLGGTRGTADNEPDRISVRSPVPGVHPFQERGFTASGLETKRARAVLRAGPSDLLGTGRRPRECMLA